MATGATGGDYGLLTWIAGGAVVVGVAVGGMYYAGLFEPSAKDIPEQTTTSTPDDIQPDIADSSNPTPNVDDDVQDDVQPDAAAEAPPATTDDATADDTQVTEAEPVPSEPILSAPNFDVVRMDPDGNAVIAGTGPAGARVTIFLDGQEQASTIVDRSGAFVSLLSIAPSQAARILSMTANLDGQTRPSDDQIILAPTPVSGPKPDEDVQVAAVEPVGSEDATSGQAPVEAPVEAAQTTAPSDPASEPALAQSDTVQPDPVTATATANEQPVTTEITAETAAVPSTEPVQTATAEPAQTGEVEPDAVATTGNEPIAETEPAVVAEVTKPEPAEPEPAQIDPSDPAATSTESTPPQTTDTAQSEPQVTGSDVAALPVATDDVVQVDTTALSVASEEITSQPATTETVAAIQLTPQNTPTDQNDQTLVANPDTGAEAVPDDQTPDEAPVDTEPVAPDPADTQVASETTQPTVAATEQPDSALDVQADVVDAPDTSTAQTAQTPPADQNIETAALADPASEAPVIAAQPAAPQEQVTTAVPELAPAPVQPLTPNQPSIQSQPQSPALITILRAGPDGVEVLQSGTPKPQTPDKIALDLISYSEAGEIQLSGRAQVRSVVRVYLDNKPVGDLVTDDTGRWSGEIEGIAPGIYTLRLDELGQAGSVLSRIETPFKRESPDVLRPPQDPNQIATSNTADGGPVPAIRAVTVQQGDTLWAISRERYGDGVLYVRVFEANRGDIRDPDLIYPGQVFALPE